MRNLCARARWHDEQGTTLVELLVVTALMIVVVGATISFLEVSTRGQRRDQAFGQQVVSTQTELARFTRDLRSATKITSASPNTIEFLLRDPSSGSMYDIKYDCSQPDSLGAGYTRCARLQSTVPAPLPAVPATAGALDVQHVENGLLSTYCSANGVQLSGSVFYYQDPSVTDPNPSPPACDESYQATVASVAPPYVQVALKVPASGDLKTGGLQHSTTFATAAYLRNQGSGA